MQQTESKTKSNETLTNIKINEQIQIIYTILTRLGCPQLLKQRKQKNPSEILALYFQSTPSRYNLIQWLISQAYPLYLSQNQFLHPLSLILPTNQKLAAILWRLGLMPYSKHTKSMDYLKYVDGLLGYQNAVKLIYDLVCFVNIGLKFEKQNKDNNNIKVKQSQDQATFGYCLNELIQNFETLVNTKYQPYGITFPQAFGHLDERNFNRKYEQLQKKIQKMNRHLQCQEKPSGDYTKMFENFEKRKQQYHSKMSQLIKKLHLLKSQYPQYQKPLTSQTIDKQIQANINSRTIDISVQLCEKMRQLRKLKNKRVINQNHQIKQILQQIHIFTQTLNEEVRIS